MKMSKTMSGDYINLDNVQTFYVAEIMNGLLRTGKVGIYARLNASQTYLLKIYELADPSLGMDYLKNKAQEDLDYTLANLDNGASFDHKPVLTPEETEKLNKAIAEGKIGPKKRTPRKKVTGNE